MTLILLLGMVLFALTGEGLKEHQITKVERNDYGEGKVSDSYLVYVDGKKTEDELKVDVAERTYTNEECKEALEQAAKFLELKVLGENESPDKVTKDLDLIRQIPNEPIEVNWETDRHDVVDLNGKLDQKVLRDYPEGIIVDMRATLTCVDVKEESLVKEMALQIFPRKLKKEEKLMMEIQEAVQENEEGSRTQKKFQFPEEVGGHKVQFKKRGDQRGIYLFALSFIICFLLFCLKKQETKKEEQKRNRQMVLDYPEIVHKISLLVGGGMSVKNAWNKIGEDYGKKREQLGKRYAYEEILKTCHEMQSSVSESESYINFGRRCKIREYRKLGALLSQNTKKGNKGLIELLAAEASYAFEERRTEAKRQGEEAETKLLLPMFLMMAVVLIIVIIPAFLAINI